jgi:hypothetical protein
MDEWNDKKDRLRNEYIRGSIGVASIVDKMIENILGWFRYMMRREESKAVRVDMKNIRLREKNKRKTKKEMVVYD